MEAVHTRRDTLIALTLGHIARTVLVHAHDAITNTRAFRSGLFLLHPLPGISTVGDSGFARKGNQPVLTYRVSDVFLLMVKILKCIYVYVYMILIDTFSHSCFMFFHIYPCIVHTHCNNTRVSLRIYDLPCFVFYERSRALPASKYAHARFVASLCTWLPITHLHIYVSLLLVIMKDGYIQKVFSCIIL